MKPGKIPIALDTSENLATALAGASMLCRALEQP